MDTVTQGALRWAYRTASTGSTLRGFAPGHPGRRVSEVAVVFGRVAQFVKVVKGFPEQARVLQEQALAMHEAQQQAQHHGHHGHQAAHDQGGGGGGAAPSFDPTSWLLPPSEFVKRGTCTSCGAPKELPTVREYLYCDFCGQLTDYDLRRAQEAGLRAPTSQTFAQVANELTPQADRARDAGDRQGYAALQHRLHVARAELTPWTVPPRAWNDEAYRRRWIDYTTAVVVAAAFDPSQVAHAERVRKAALRVQWRGGMGLGAFGGSIAMLGRIATHGLDMQKMTPKLELESFWPLVDAFEAQIEDLLGLIRREGIGELDPDMGSDELTRRLAKSVMAQGWLRHMEPEDGEAYIERMGLRHEYQRARVHGDIRHCGGCGHDVTALPGATAVVCDGCGRRVDLASPQATCTGCNAVVCFIEGATHLNCPYCAAEMRRV
ncbi:heterocycloanthracin/sonorensin family bacteriocin [Euzebya sp.]|uniref:heterocycloanthracin/sonorensin family bacteriocin n=1 Tax=Euzebya sp. TaxID=1971409 RepID=UPI003513475A